MGAKSGALYISRREHPKIVQPELANRHHLRLPRHLAEVRSHLLAVGRSIVWVNTHTGKDHPWIALRQSQRSPARGQVAPRINHARHPTGNSSLNDVATVHVETSSINMRMTIDEQQDDPFLT